MALLKEIEVPLLAVNDTTLTVVELPFSAGDAVKKGDVILVLETSKTSYDVEAEVDGYIQYLCEADRDYAVNEIVARIYSEAAEVKTTAPVMSPASRVSRPVAAAVAVAATHWNGTTLFSHEAERLIGAAGLAREVFA